MARLNPDSPSFLARHPRLVRTVLLGTTFLAAVGAGVAYGAWALACRGGACPAIEVLDDYTPRQTSKVYAADGRFLAEIGLERRTLVRLGDIPKVVQDAFVATEDKRFYRHAGVDWMRVPGAVVSNLRAGSFSQGFSTITMQLARNIFPERISREKTPLRKLREAKVAREIESRYSKEKILELYLNQINLGNGAYGVETASQRYFGKSVRDLNLAEAATLAALPKAPTRYNPRRFPDRAIQRRNTVLEVMRRQGVVSDADASLAKAYPLRLAQRSEAGDVAPYYVEWVRQQLDAQFGKQLYEQGLKVHTTLDVDMQLAAERALERQLRAIEGGRYGRFPHPSFESYLAGRADATEPGGANTPYLQGAFVALDPRTGAVRALVGGRDYDDSKFNRATQALRQPGSTFKPFVYAAALQNGRSPSFIVSDDPLSVPQSDGSNWTPQNYDGRSEGNIALRRALYMSRNLATVRLGRDLGESAVAALARRFGLSTPIPNYPSIHLGAADVYPLELVASYSGFATLGVRAAPFAITRVESARGEVIWEPAPVRAPVLTSEEAWLMVSMMKDVVRRGTAARAVGAQFRHPAGGKTGTTNDGTDVWFVGYTADLVAGVWMGMDRPQKIKANAQGGELAAPAWTTFMNEVYRNRPAPPDWPRPAGVIVRDVDRGTGLLANAYCPRESVSAEYFIAGTEPVRECDVHDEYWVPPGTRDSLGTVFGPGATAPSTPGGISSQPLPPGGASGPTRVTPGSAPVPQPSRPARPVPRDSNPFRLPPR